MVLTWMATMATTPSGEAAVSRCQLAWKSPGLTPRGYKVGISTSMPGKGSEKGTMNWAAKKKHTGGRTGLERSALAAPELWQPLLTPVAPWLGYMKVPVGEVRGIPLSPLKVVTPAAHSSLGDHFLYPG